MSKISMMAVPVLFLSIGSALRFSDSTNFHTARNVRNQLQFILFHFIRIGYIQGVITMIVIHKSPI